MLQTVHEWTSSLYCHLGAPTLVFVLLGSTIGLQG